MIFKKYCILSFTFSVNNTILTSIQLQVLYNSMINREKINRIWKQALMLILIISFFFLLLQTV